MKKLSVNSACSESFRSYLLFSRSTCRMTELEAEQYFHQQIPITRAMGVRVVAHDESQFVVEAPVTLNFNHLGTAFGGSINAVATLAAYGLLWLELREQGRPRCRRGKLDPLFATGA